MADENFSDSNSLDDDDEFEDEQFNTFVSTFFNNDTLSKNDIPHPTFKYVIDEMISSKKDCPEIKRKENILQYMSNYTRRSSYNSMVGAIAKRADLLSRGASPLVEIEDNDDEISVALKEMENEKLPIQVQHGKFLYRFGDLEKISFKTHLSIIKKTLQE